MGNVQPFHKLIVWQEADKFVKAVYRITSSFPSEERFGVVSQIRRAALSIVLNIVEGQARGSSKDFLRFLFMARGSASECAYLLDISKHLGYLTIEKFDELENMLRSLNYLLQQFIDGLKRTTNS